MTKALIMLKKNQKRTVPATLLFVHLSPSASTSFLCHLKKKEKEKVKT
jgi:hypothetical protein